MRKDVSGQRLLTGASGSKEMSLPLKTRKFAWKTFNLLVMATTLGAQLPSREDAGEMQESFVI
jgi:hypothetical protein